MDISKIDSNFVLQKYADSGLRFFDAIEPPFVVYGLMYDEQDGFYRLPIETAQEVSDGVGVLCRSTSGGRVRFCTDSQKIVLKCVMETRFVLEHMSALGTSGFSVYVDGAFYAPIIPPPLGDGNKDAEDNGYDGVVNFLDKKMRDITIYFPLYNSVKALFIGLEESAETKESAPYQYDLPILFYGSSITQGGCASRPGNTYDAIACRFFNADYLNLGFSGRAKGETVMSEYLSQIRCLAFVYDYDHNAPSPEHLAETHYPLYRTFREKNPNTPIIMMSKPDFDKEAEINAVRRDIIKKSYELGKAQGDNNLEFIDGETLFQKEYRDCCTVDGCHPNDLGFARMASAVIPVLKKMLKKQRKK